MKRFQPIGKLPPRRSQLVEARNTAPIMDDAFIAPRAQDRLLELIEREPIPGDVRDTLAGALTGDLQRQQLLFQAMLDTWPRLQKNISEVQREVKKAPWKFQPFSKRGEEPTQKAIDKAALAEDSWWEMRPNAERDERCGHGIIESLVYGYYAGHQVVEVRWTRKGTSVVPRAGKNVPPRFYGYPYETEGEDRLMFSPSGRNYGTDWQDFPEDRFLLAMNSGNQAHASIAAPLRALSGYWLAATFGLKWLLQFAQLYGVPFRWAQYDDKSNKGELCTMLKNIGTAGWGVFPTGTEIKFEDVSKSADALPQKDLIEMADKQCDTFILGQTLTTDVGDSGSRALGDVHQDVRGSAIEGVGDFVSEIINNQFLPSLIKLNYGEAEEVPKISSDREKPKDEKSMAERDRLLFGEMGLPVDRDWIYERHGVPIPHKDSGELFQTKPNGDQGEPDTGDKKKESDPAPHETKARLKASNNPLSTIDRLAVNVLQDVTGVTKEWLRPVRPFFERLAALSLSKQVSDEDFLEALEKAQKEMPELFDRLNTEVLEESMAKAVGSAMIAGSVNRYES